MEVSYHHQPKRVYRHAVPVVALSLLLLVVAAALYVQLGSVQATDGHRMTQAIVTPVVQTRANEHGLAKVQAHGSSDTTSAVPGIGNGFSEVGGGVSRSFSVQGAR